MTSTHVERFSGTADEWDSFVRSQAGWTVFHLHSWKPLIEEAFGHECPYFACRSEDGRLTGVLPLVRVRSLMFGHFLVSMPFVNYGGPLGESKAIGDLCQAARTLAAVGSVKLLELRSRTALPVDMSFSHRKITVLLDLPPDAETLRKRIGAKVRSQIKRPVKEGVTVRFGGDQVEPFYEVYSRHMRDLGTPAQPLELFRQIRRRFQESAWFGCAWLGDRPIAGGAGFRWADEFEMTWASSLYSHNKISPNMLLYWEFMAKAIDDGARVFNFGRCSPESGTHRFKRQWGSRDEQLWWYQQSRTTDAKTPSPDDGVYSLGPRVWRRLPVSIATLVGPRIVRYIP